MGVLRIIHDIRDFRRFQEILSVVFEEGFGYLLTNTSLRKYIPFHKRLTSKFQTMEEVSNPVRLRRILERLGPTFIKLGQTLSLRPDLIPKDYIKELEKMQDQVQGFSYEQAKDIVEKELKQPLRKKFKTFSHRPIASASISQVHKATLLNGKIVAVKVKRPEVGKIMDKDIDIMFHLAHLLEHNNETLHKYKISRIVEEFAKWTHLELDFRNEAKNAIRFRHNFDKETKLKIPKVYTEYTTPNLLVLEFIHGIELNKFNKAHKSLNIKQGLKIGFETTLTQVFKHGFFHADPHPGNIFLCKGNKIALVDFGIVGHFNDKLKKSSNDLFIGIITKDTNKIVKTLLGMGLNTNNLNIDELKYELEHIIIQLEDSSIGDMQVSVVLEEVLDIMLKYQVRMPVDFVLFGKTIGTLEGVALKYDPKFRIVDSCKPVLKKIMKEKFNVRENFKQRLKSMEEFGETISNIPLYTIELMNKIKEGRIKIDVDDTDIKRLSIEMEHSSGNLAVGMIISALIISSALTYDNQFNNGLLIYGYPLLPLMGWTIGMILSIWIVKRTVFARIWS